MDTERLLREFYERDDLISCPLFVKPITRESCQKLRNRKPKVVTHSFVDPKSAPGQWDLDSFEIFPIPRCQTCTIPEVQDVQAG